MGSSAWIQLLGRFLAGNPRVRLLTLHRYPLKHCRPTERVTIADLLSAAASDGLAQTVVHSVALAHARGIRLRIDEMSSISCGGFPGISDAFASALWSLDTMFAMAHVGVDGINVQTAPHSLNELFSITQSKHGWQAFVHPLYYGLMMFAQAAPPGSRLLSVSGASLAGVRAWATRAPDGRVRVVLINPSTTHASTVAVRIPKMTSPVTLERLQASGVHAKHDVTIGGQSFGRETGTGLLAGPSRVTPVTPVAGYYVFDVPAASAAMLTASGGR
jgi:hypothetical protein